MNLSRSSARSPRRHDLDWLRVLAVLLLVPFHTALIFSLNPLHIVYVKDRVESPALLWLADFLYQWHMPVLFVIAGSAMFFALGSRSNGAYLRERALRLLVPFTFGLVALIPPMLYIQFWWNPALQGRYASFWDYYPHFFQVSGDLSGYGGGFSPAHLWFILYLFVFSVVALPLFRALRSETGARVTDALARFLAWPGMLYLLGAPLLLARWTHLLGDKNPLFYILLFIYGYIFISDARLQAAIDRQRWTALILGIAANVAFWAFELAGRGLLRIPRADVWHDALYPFNAMFWLVALLGFGHVYLNRDNALLRYANEAAYPFYLLHLPVNTLVGYYVVQLPTNSIVKFLIINVVTIALTLAVYDLLVKRVGILRFLFGMKQQAARPPKLTTRGAQPMA